MSSQSERRKMSYWLRMARISQMTENGITKTRCPLCSWYTEAQESRTKDLGGIRCSNHILTEHKDRILTPTLADWSADYREVA